jgi:hypothetical protein
MLFEKGAKRISPVYSMVRPRVVQKRSQANWLRNIE